MKESILNLPLIWCALKMVVADKLIPGGKGLAGSNLHSPLAELGSNSAGTDPWASTTSK